VLRLFLASGGAGPEDWRNALPASWLLVAFECAAVRIQWPSVVELRGRRIVLHPPALHSKVKTEMVVQRRMPSFLLSHLA
jgi:hypothetical protein